MDRERGVPLRDVDTQRHLLPDADEHIRANKIAGHYLGLQLGKLLCVEALM